MSSKNINLRKSQRVYLFFKRCIDIFGAITGLLVLSLFFLIVPIIIKCTSKGPIFFKQERLGKNKKVFKIIKFRSMHQNAKEIAPSDMTEEDQKAMEYKWGQFMRRTSIDEIPQLFNILKGDMSFIGPRPGAAHNEELLIECREKYVPGAFDVKPGLSGYAQTRMNRSHDPEQKAYYDHIYAQKMSFIFDTKIFLYTILKLFGAVKGR